MYDFDSIIRRKHTNSVKWDSDKEEDIIPLWVADMDFKAAPCIQQALEKRVKHGVFGYAVYHNLIMRLQLIGFPNVIIGKLILPT